MNTMLNFWVVKGDVITSSRANVNCRKTYLTFYVRKKAERNMAMADLSISR